MDQSRWGGALGLTPWVAADPRSARRETPAEQDGATDCPVRAIGTGQVFAPAKPALPPSMAVGRRERPGGESGAFMQSTAFHPTSDVHGCTSGARGRTPGAPAEAWQIFAPCKICTSAIHGGRMPSWATYHGRFSAKLVGPVAQLVRAGDSSNGDTASRGAAEKRDEFRETFRKSDGNPEPSRRYTAGRCRDYLGTQASLITGFERPAPERHTWTLVCRGR